MRKRLLALLLLFTLAGPLLAGSYQCVAGDSSDSMKEMACCREAESPTGSFLAKLCCETLCLKPTGGTSIVSFNTPPQAPAPVWQVLVALFIPPLPVSKPVYDKPAYHLPPAHSPPEIYLYNSTFLI